VCVHTHTHIHTHIHTHTHPLENLVAREEITLMQLLADIAMLGSRRYVSGQPNADGSRLVPQARSLLCARIDLYHANFPESPIALSGKTIHDQTSTREKALMQQHTMREEERLRTELARTMEKERCEQERQALADSRRLAAERLLAKTKAAEDEQAADIKKYAIIQVI
jgi:hypothetical protein